MKFKYTAAAARWFDKVNGNTYHSVWIINNETGETLHCPFQHGNGDQYRQTALETMAGAGWLPEKYQADKLYLYERENDYPINWVVSDVPKRVCVANGKA